MTENENTNVSTPTSDTTATTPETTATPEGYTYRTITRLDSALKYKFAEIKYGKIVAIHEHWVPLSEFSLFFEPDAYFIDITGVMVDGEDPTVGDVVTFGEHGYEIKHLRQSMSVAETKNYVIEKLKLTRNQKELEPVEYNGTWFDADKDSLTRIDIAQKALENAAEAGNSTSITWTTADNNHVEMTIEDFKALTTLIASRSSNLHNRYNELKTYIESLPDEELDTVLNITWDYEIPESTEKNVESSVESEDSGDGGSN